MRKTVLRIILAGSFFLVVSCKTGNAMEERSSSVRGKQFTESLRDACNQTMIAIYNDILSVKKDYDNLTDYGQQTLSLNQHGIYAIEYQHTLSGGVRDGEFLGFGVTIVNSEDTNFHEFGQQAFNFNFPLLGIKFAGYQKTNRKWMRFNIQEIVQKNGDVLLDEQQKYLPLKLSLQTDKESYKTGENMEITVVLENISRKNLWVKDLDKETLYFLYDNASWGAVEVGQEKEKKKKFVLEPGKKIYKKFVGSGSSVPDEIEIYCSYAITFEGVKPSSVLKVKITE